MKKPENDNFEKPKRERILLYGEGNPVKAALVESPHEWRHSSAWERHGRGLELGQPMTRPKPAL